MRTRTVVIVVAVMLMLAIAVILRADDSLAVDAVKLDCSGDGGGPWLLVYRWSFTDDDGLKQTREGFDGRRFMTEEEAYCGAEQLRVTGVKLPTLARYGRDSNVIPDSITPMPSLMAVEQGITGPAQR